MIHRRLSLLRWLPEELLTEIPSGIFVILQTLHALRAGYRGTGSARLFLLTGAGAFIPFALFMGTDNIILYAAFFGNLHFMMLGAGYAALANKDAVAVNPVDLKYQPALRRYL